MNTAEYWIAHLQLQQHIEGGWYKEVYRSPLILGKENLSASFHGNRNACTHIYFLLEKGNFSAFHRIASDELWHFYNGDPLLIYEIDQEGKLIAHLLGNDINAGQTPFCVIRAGNWFGSRPARDSNYSLVGCTVSPGFDFADFEMAKQEELIRQYPEHREVIRAMCR